MICPTCQNETSEVIDSRQRGDMRWRRHRCALGHTFTTYELTARKLGEIEAGGNPVIARKLKNAVRLLEAALKSCNTAVYRHKEETP